MTGYFINDCMIGFTTRVFYKNILEGYLHGIDYSINKRYALYENILYDDVKAAIENRASRLNLGTTALGMKSAVGAVPVPMKSYLKFKNHAINKVINPGEYFTTEEKVIRFPFKIKERLGTIRFDSKGPVHVRLITEKEFMKQDEYVESLIFNTEKPEISEVEFSFENIPVGVYAIIAFQDKNNNGRLDHILGLYPSEPFGFSWKAKAKRYPDSKTYHSM